MNSRIIFSIVAACSLSVAALAGVSAVAIASTSAVPGDGPRPSAPPAASTSLTVAATAPAPKVYPAVGGDVGRPLQPGDVLVTEAQIRKVLYANDVLVRADDPNNPPPNTANLDDGALESFLDVKCMAAKGFYYNPIATLGQQSGRMDPAAWDALWGNTGGGDAYRWQDAGCHGQSVHETGNDNNN